MAISSNCVTSKTVRDTVHELNEATKGGCSITLLWIKAHVDIHGNELADHAAKIGAEMSDDSDSVPISPCYVKNQVKEVINTMWQADWENYPLARQTKQFFARPDASKTKYILKHGRHKVTRLLNIFTGHNTLNYHASLQNGLLSDCCRFCNIAQETFYHWITECPRLRIYREDIFLDSIPIYEMKWSVQKVLDFSYKPSVCNALDQFQVEENI